MKKKIGNVFTILFAIGVLMYYLITAVSDLTNIKDLHNINLEGALEILKVEHSINGFIPLGEDYYYIGVEEGTNNAYIINVSKKWIENNFDSDHMAKDADGIRITALARKEHDYKISRELRSRAENIEKLNYPLGTEYYLDMGYKEDAITKLIVVALCVLLTITLIFFVKPESEVKPILAKCWFVGMIITLFLMIKCII